MGNYPGLEWHRRRGRHLSSIYRERMEKDGDETVSGTSYQSCEDGPRVDS